MSNTTQMARILVTCAGISPLMMDKMSDETLEGLRTGNHPTKPKDRPLKDVAAEKLYLQNGDDGPIGIMQEMLFACLRAAGRKVKNGKAQLSTATSTTLPDFLRITNFFMPLYVPGADDKTVQPEWVPDKRRGQMKTGSTSVAVCIVRPRFDLWSFDVVIEYDHKKIDETVIRALFDNAGSSQGLGSFRPNKNGPFGTFKVTSWVVEKPEGADDEDVEDSDEQVASGDPQDNSEHVEQEEEELVGA